MGANISGIGSNLLTIEGVSHLRGYRTYNASRYGRNWFLDWSFAAMTKSK